eukprot:109886-Rhodomonas_salina.2
MDAMKKIDSDLSQEAVVSGKSEKRGAGRPHCKPASARSASRRRRGGAQKNLQREKERVEQLEELQSQIELVKQEHADSRIQRHLEQVSLAASESQASQLRAALTSAEDDLKSLHDALNQESERSHRLQGALSQKEEELQMA